jgi:hypothetical protein
MLISVTRFKLNTFFKVERRRDKAAQALILRFKEKQKKRKRFSKKKL